VGFVIQVLHTACPSDCDVDVTIWLLELTFGS
jgi:hypothetical protein